MPTLVLAPFATPALERVAPRVSPSVTSMAQSGVLPNVSLTTHNNQIVNFYEDLVRSKTVLMHFFFNQSREEPSAAAMENLLEAQSLLGDKMGKDIFFLSITSQPLDTLSHYVQLFEQKVGCKLLAGKPQDVYLLRKSLGFSGNNPVLRRDINHDAVIARFDENGLKRWGMVSLSESPEHIANAFKGLGV
jgi:protein SCO1